MPGAASIFIARAQCGGTAKTGNFARTTHQLSDRQRRMRILYSTTDRNAILGHVVLSPPSASGGGAPVQIRGSALFFPPSFSSLPPSPFLFSLFSFLFLISLNDALA